MADNNEIEFNSMVAVLKRLDKITYEINEARRYGKTTEMIGLLFEYFKEISIDLDDDESKIHEKLIKMLNYQPNVRKSKKWLLIELDKIDVDLRRLAKKKGYLTKQALDKGRAIYDMG